MTENDQNDDAERPRFADVLELRIATKLVEDSTARLKYAHRTLRWALLWFGVSALGWLYFAWRLCSR